MKKLDKTVQLQVLNYFDDRIALSDDPRSFGKPLKSTFSGLWRRFKWYGRDFIWWFYYDVSHFWHRIFSGVFL